MNRKKELCRNFQRGSCQYGSRCKFLHTTQQETKPNPYGFGNQSTIHFPNTTQQQKPNPYGFGVQNKPQLQNNTPQKGSSNFVAKYQTPAKPFENKWTRSSSSGAANVTATQAQAQSQVSDHKCTDPESCKKQIIEDFKNEAPLWKLTCYGHRKYGPCDIVGDISYEELRSAAYDDARQGSSVQSIVERERKLYLSKLNEFDNLLKKPYGSQSPSFHQMNSTPISSSPQMSQSPMLMNNASSVNVQGNNVPSFSSFSQLKATTNLGYENRSDPQGFPSGNFGQPSPFQKVSQSSFGFGKFGNSGLFGQQPIQPAGNFPNPSVSSFNFAVRSIGSPSPQNFGGTNSQQLNSVSRAGTPSSDDEFEVDDSIWRKEEWKIGEIPERPPPAGVC
ncbi:zinc finger CCCH domain-containing protein 46-like isoform X1 [Zingiber officinale]|uniref:zinc finger CCCH domain-containing protein 46-like isoform X1 n=1 Tax=Zingiber officinale TaxID=94328 RepID=UPI001C4B83FE|nr:zinc finger CCCH domain-containing protein 46-like isoform X1 [Zingiber officinale]